MRDSGDQTLAPTLDRPPSRRITFGFLGEYGIVLAFFAVFAALSLLTPAFFTVRNMLNVLDQVAQVGLVALGMSVAMLGAGFDFSSGSIFAAAGSLAAFVALQGYPVLGMVVGVLLGLVLGTINGVLITGFRIDSFIATLATALVIRGLAHVLTGGLLLQVDDPRFIFLGRTRFLGVKMPVYFFLSFAFLMWLLVSRSTFTFGRYVYAIGGNEEAARLLGIRVGLIRTATFAISGLAAAMAGVIGASRISTGQANVGEGIALTAFAAIVIGGNSIMGGEGAVWRTLVGVLLLQLMSNGLNILAVPPFYQLIFEGGVILFAVALDALRHRRV